ncbi:hypothetical protein [Geodermatophilus sp. SYSU D01119]
MPATASPPLAPAARTGGPPRPLLLAAAAWSVAHLALGLRWVLDPASRPGLDGDGENGGAGLLTVLPPDLTAWLVLGLAAGGLAATAVAAWRRPSAGGAALALAVAVGLAALTADMRVLVLLGYLCALVAPAAFLVVFTVGAVRSRRARPWLLAVAAVVVAGLLSGVLDPGTVARLAGEMRGPLARELPSRGHLALLLGGTVLMAWLGVRVLRAARGACGACGRPGPAWTRPEAAARWGRVATLVAAACPLPYGLLRMTWLTPWEVGLPDGSDPALRLFGLALGVAALGGAVATLGLIRPWGEVWPSWVPVLRGRPVPVRVPVLAGGSVAVVLLASGPSMLAVGIAGLGSGDPLEAAFLLLFPTLLWGVALGLAVLAYALRRRGTCPVCGGR